jgi:hypothetical protein
MSNDIEVLRNGLKTLPQVAAHKAADTPDLREIFTPVSHEGALDPAREIVVGDRGMGKSFWSSVLKDDAARAAVAVVYPSLKLADLTVSLGFSEALARDKYPSERVISQLLNNGIEPEIIWRTVVMNSISSSMLPSSWTNMDWASRCKWIAGNPQQEEQALLRFDGQIRSQKKKHLIVFDALDRLGRDWSTIRRLTKSLLEVALDLRSFPGLRVKIFIRPDMQTDREIWSIRDGSKLKQNIVSINWTSLDLYGFVWHWFMTEPSRIPSFFLTQI